MSKNASVLDAVNVTTPCTASWDAMLGDRLSRFCLHCSKHVYDISQLTRAEAEALILEKDGRLCVRYYRRADGRIMTQDCGPTPRFRTPMVVTLALTFVALIVLLIFRAFVGSDDQGQANFLRQVEPFRTVMEWLDPSPPVMVMGEPCRMPVVPAPGPAPQVVPEENPPMDD